MDSKELLNIENDEYRIENGVLVWVNIDEYLLKMDEYNKNSIRK